MTRRAFSILALASTLLAQEAPQGLITGRCRRELPLDAGQGFDHQRFLVQADGAWLFDPAYDLPGARWRLRNPVPRIQVPAPPGRAGIRRFRRKWRDGALWQSEGTRIYRWDDGARAWSLKADPGLAFMDFEVDMTGRILLVATADPKTRLYRALLEAAPENGHPPTILAPYPDPGCLDWGRRVSPVAAATLQAGYESVQILEFTLLYNPLARRLFIFSPLEDRIREVNLGLPVRGYPDLMPPGPGPLDDLCWQVLPKDTSEAWLVFDQGHGAGLAAIPLDLFEGTAGERQPLPGLSLPVLPDPTGRLTGLEEALEAFRRPARAGTTPPRPSPG